MVSFFWISGYSLLYSYITPYIQEYLIVSDRHLSIIFLLFGLATLAGNKLGGFYGDKYGLGPTITTSMIIHVFALVILSLFKGNLIMTVLCLVIWPFAAWTPGPLLRFSIIELVPGASSVILSLYNSIIQIGFASGSVIGGSEIKHFPMVTLSWTSVGVVFTALCLSFLLFYPKRIFILNRK